MELPGKMRATYDIVFASIGVLCWIPDIDRFAGIVRQLLKPGGFFYLLDGHPFRDLMLEETEQGEVILKGGRRIPVARRFQALFKKGRITEANAVVRLLEDDATRRGSAHDQRLQPVVRAALVLRPRVICRHDDCADERPADRGRCAGKRPERMACAAAGGSCRRAHRSSPGTRGP